MYMQIQILSNKVKIIFKSVFRSTNGMKSSQNIYFFCERCFRKIFIPVTSSQLLRLLSSQPMKQKKYKEKHILTKHETQRRKYILRRNRFNSILQCRIYKKPVSCSNVRVWSFINFSCFHYSYFIQMCKMLIQSRY